MEYSNSTLFIKFKELNISEKFQSRNMVGHNSFADFPLVIAKGVMKGINKKIHHQ